MDTVRPLLLVFPFGYLSHYLRCLVLCNHLKDAFEILFAYHEDYSSFVEREGFDSFAVASLNEVEVLSSVKEFDFSWLNEQSLEKCFLSQVDAIERYQPLAVLGDAAPSLRMAAAYSGVCFVALLNGYMSKYYAHARCLSKKHPAFNYLAWLPSAIKERLTTHGESIALRKVHEPFKKLRTDYRLKPRDSYLDELEGDYTVLCDLPRLFPQKDLPGNFTSLGPLIYDVPEKSTLSDRLAPGKKTIFISMGSTGDWTAVRFLNQAHYSRFNIVAAGDTDGILDAAHIIRTGFAAANDIFPHTHLVICHGGNGTIYQALAYGIPLLCSPSHFEQEWNLAALEKAGLAGSLDKTGHDCHYRALIDTWIARKELPIYKGIQRDIDQAGTAIAEKLELLTSAILTRQVGAQALIQKRLGNLV